MELSSSLTAAELAHLLAQENFAPVYAQADRVRHEQVGDTVQIRAILEFSNHCRRQCRYCGLNSSNTQAQRYRMPPEEIVSTALEAAAAGYRTIVLQSGEDRHYSPALLAQMIREIKRAAELSITVSCGEFCFDDLKLLREAGADRYLLKHETADPLIYRELHPCGTLAQRVQCLRDIKTLGFETGSGFMIGLPGQTPDTLAADLLLLQELGCDMAGIGPFIAHPQTPLRGFASGSTELTKRAVALVRILLPKANLPATTSLGVLDGDEKADVFSCGANVIMRKVTPEPYKQLYEIYPAPLSKTDIRAERLALEAQIKKMGKIPL